MKVLWTSLIITGAAVGIYFLLKDNENVKEALNSAKDNASEALKKVNLKKVGSQAAKTLAEQA